MNNFFSRFYSLKVRGLKWRNVEKYVVYIIVAFRAEVRGLKLAGPKCRISCKVRGLKAMLKNLTS